MMKKIFLTLIFVLTIKGYGQTYSLGMHVYVTGGFASVESNAGGQIYSFTVPYDYNSTYGSQDYPFLTTVKGNSFIFKLKTQTKDCWQDLSATKSLLELLRDGFVLNSCPTSFNSGFYGNFYSLNFKPNGITILNKNSTTQVCSGEQLELEANTNIFPNEVYHWQFSFDNKISWFDVPAKFNNNPKTSFSINDLLYNINLEYFNNKQIYFRLGYGYGYTNELSIIFKTCGPTVSSISYEGPKCNGDIVKSLAITFEDKLNSIIGEKLASISVCDINDNTKIFMQINGPISYPDDTKTYKYATTDLQQLESGKKYKIRYQAQIPDPKDPSKTIMRGVLESPSTLNFLYKEFEALKFEPVTKTPPLCHSGEALIELKVSGGAGDYYFTLDKGIEKKFTNSTTSIITTNPITKIETEKRTGSETIPISSDTSHSIKIRDTNYCIDKTAND